MDFKLGKENICKQMIIYCPFWGGGDYQLRSALAAKQIWVAVITIWGTLDSLPCPTDITQSGTQGSHEYHSQYQSGYSLVCILRHLSHRYYQFISKSSSIFQENDSGRFLFPNQETIIITLQSKQSLIPTEWF